MAGIGLPFFRGADPRRPSRKTATVAKIASAETGESPGNSDATEEVLPEVVFDPEPEEGGSTVRAGKQQAWPRSLSRRDRGLIARAAAETEKLQELAGIPPDLAQLQRIDPRIELDQDGNIKRRRPTREKLSEADAAFLFMMNYRR